MLTVRTSENTVITSFRLITERQDFSSVRTGENTVRARARIHQVTNCLQIRIFHWEEAIRQSLRAVRKDITSSLFAHHELPERTAHAK